jgi:uncharacterized protein YecT (DUF1311 family)
MMSGHNAQLGNSSAHRSLVWKSIGALLIVGCAVEALAQNATTGKNWDQVCRDATAQPLIEPKLNGPINAAGLPSCNAGGSYYGIFGSKQDYAAALQCGWYQRTHPESGNKDGDIDHGVGTLMMLYANGLGVERNHDLAIRFACEYDREQKKARLDHLDALTNSVQNPKPLFDVCDDVTGRIALGQCEGIKQALDDLDHEKTFALITNNLTPAQSWLFEKLRAAEGRFESFRASREVDRTLGNLWAEQDRGRLKKQFLDDLQRFAKNSAPPATAQDVKKLDARMNAVYQKVTQPGATFEGTINPERVRETQQAWLQVRETWMDFAKAAYPRLAPERVEAQLLRLRLNQLQLLPVRLP